MRVRHIFALDQEYVYYRSRSLGSKKFHQDPDTKHRSHGILITATQYQREVEREFLA